MDIQRNWKITGGTLLALMSVVYAGLLLGGLAMPLPLVPAQCTGTHAVLCAATAALRLGHQRFGLTDGALAVRKYLAELG